MVGGGCIWRFVLRKFTSWGSRSSYLLTEAILPPGRPSPHVQGTSTVPALCQERGDPAPPTLSCWTEHLQVIFPEAQGTGRGGGHSTPVLPALPSPTPRSHRSRHFPPTFQLESYLPHKPPLRLPIPAAFLMLSWHPPLSIHS